MRTSVSSTIYAYGDAIEVTGWKLRGYDPDDDVWAINITDDFTALLSIQQVKMIKSICENLVAQHEELQVFKSEKIG